MTIRYWTAHSDRDYEDDCGMYDEPETWEEEMEDDITMVPITSSNIAAAGYDDDTRTLRIEFSNGATYEYSGVSRDYFDGLLAANSPGAYFHRNIKESFRHTRLS